MSPAGILKKKRGGARMAANCGIDAANGERKEKKTSEMDVTYRSHH